MLPKRMAIRHGSCYLRSVHEEGNGVVVQLGGGGGANDPRCRFSLEASKEHDHDSGLMHVVCCHNNKYWVPQQLRGHDGCIIGTADEPEEDLSKPSCTLFNLHILPATQHEERSIRFLHCMLGKCVAVLPSSDTPSRRPYLHVAHGEADVADAFTFLDLSQHKQLPKYLAFKGDNGKYLGVHLITENITSGLSFGPPSTTMREYLQFASKDMGDPRVVHTSFTNDDGTVCIKSNHADKFWRLDTSWIRADSDDKNRQNTLFQVIADDDTDEAGANFIILRNQGNNKICKRLPSDGKAFCSKRDCLTASDDSITQSSRLQVEEPVLSRLIYDVEFHLREARVYTEVSEVITRTFDNKTDSIDTAKFTFTYQHTEAKTWSNSTSIKVAGKTTIKAPVPCIVDGKVEVSAEVSHSRTKGGTENDARTRTTDYTAPVPARTRLTVRAVASKGTCDVPYSYKQKDVLLGGEVVIHEFHDGIFSGVSTDDLKYEVREEELKSHHVIVDAS